ncbi:protein kinase domain-containing protein [Sorangium sp. So ce1335]|uniref:serine/threonine-protein kinase n=1 Tax=Sorangium sp. So ce1335 TaxID=3133335 RepID=UPI003F5F2705
MELEAGTVVANRYRIIRQLGRGGMGEVFAAENIRTGRQVAIKLLRPDSKAKSSAAERFRREARAAGSINSDHVTEILDVEEDPEHGIVLVFELLEGESLIDRLKRTGPISFEELHPIIEQVWMGLADAHRAGIIHRDLKPSNVYLEARPDGSTRVKILDFGISKLPKEMGGETLTEMGQSLGTFSFMPPEQIGKAKTVDHRADIYACTTMIYQSMSGQLPYQARNLLIMVEMKQKTDARRLSDAMDGPVDPRLEAFLAKGLAREPADRFQSALEGLTAWRELRPVRGSSHPVSGSRASLAGGSAAGGALVTPLPPQTARPPSSGALRSLQPPVDPVLIRTQTDPAAQALGGNVTRPRSEHELAAHALGQPPLAETEDQRPSHAGSAAGGQLTAPPAQWTGPNGTMVLNNAAGELAPPVAAPPAGPPRILDLSEESSAGSTSQGPTLIYRPTRPTMGSASSGLPAPGGPEPIEQRPPARTLRTIVYVLAALLFAVVGFLLMGIALEYLDAAR